MWNYLSRPESPEDAYRRAQTAWLENDHGAVYDSLSVLACVEADALFEAELAKDADRCSDPAEAARLRSLRGRAAFVETCARADRGLPQLQWGGIIRSEKVGDDMVRLTLERPPRDYHSTTGVVIMVRESSVWKIGPMVGK